MTGSKKCKNEIESKFQKDAINLIRKMGGYMIKVHVSAYQSEGEPDLIVCYKGRFIAFELKVDGNKPSALQLEKMEQIRLSGGIAKAIWTLEEIKETLYEVSRIQQGGQSQ